MTDETLAGPFLEPIDGYRQSAASAVVQMPDSFARRFNHHLQIQRDIEATRLTVQAVEERLYRRWIARGLSHCGRGA